jgi:hypothetical protein
MKRIAWCLLALLLFAQYSANAAQEKTPIQPPSVLLSFLRDNPKYHLLTSADIKDESEKKTFIHWDGNGGFKNATFRVMDTNRDGKNDVVAVVVKNGLFSALVFQAASNGYLPKPFWLIQDSQETIGGILVNGGNYITLNNLDCCYTPWVFAWSGSAYEMNINLPGAYVCIDGTEIYSKEDNKSALKYKINEKVGATVVEIGRQQEEYRWYKIKLRNKKGQTGFVLSDAFLDGTECAELKD